MKKSVWGTRFVFLFVAVLILGGMMACQKTGIEPDKGLILRITEMPLKLGSLVRETDSESARFRAEIFNISEAPVKYFIGTVVFYTEDGFVYGVQAFFTPDSPSIPPGGKTEISIPITNEKIRTAKLVVKEVLYEAFIELNEPRGTVYSKWINPNYDAELNAAKNSPLKEKE